MKKNEIRAVYTKESIRVYQAYSYDIASEAVKLGTFGSKFSMDRMSWIKPSFLWMMYRSGWGTKKNQEYILAIDLKREGFDYIVRNAVLSTYLDDLYHDHEEWKRQLQNSDIRCQWDPERDVFGNALTYRSIQLGIRGEILKKYVSDWIVNLTDITKYVNFLKDKKDKDQDITELLPNKRIYKPSNGKVSCC